MNTTREIKLNQPQKYGWIAQLTNIYLLSSLLHFVYLLSSFTYHACLTIMFDDA